MTGGPVVGVISDTHGLLRPEAVAALRDVDLIVHAGDIGSPDVLDQLRTLAPVLAVRGNNDRGPWAPALPEVLVTEVHGARLCVIHDLKELRVDLAQEGIAVVISGHSHRPSVDRRGEVLFLNPGSAGPRRFTLPVAVARLHLDATGLRAEIVPLDVAAPGTSGPAGGPRSLRTSRAPRRAETPPPRRGSGRSPRTYGRRPAGDS